MLERREFICKSLKTLTAAAFLPGLKAVEDVEEFFLELNGKEIFTREALYYSQQKDNLVRCELCFRGCRLPSGESGYCGVRKNEEGTLLTLVYGNMAAVTYGPVEKKPLHQYRPSAQANNYGTAGCNLSCKFCQNWRLSQRRLEEVGDYEHVKPEEAVLNARSRGADLISFTYNEPTVFYEFMLETARLAREENMGANVNTNACLQQKPLRELMEYADSATVDLKGFSEDFYRDLCDGELQPVLRNLKIIKEMGVWLEIVNLVIPTLNDDMDKIEEMCQWIKEELGPETPVHFNRFMPRYKLQDLSSTPVASLEKARETAVETGLDYVYVGNVPGHRYNATFCPDCGEKIISRVHFTIEKIDIEEERCQHCGSRIAGVW